MLHPGRSFQGVFPQKPNRTFRQLHLFNLTPYTPVTAGEALDNGVQIAVCSTSNERAVATIVRRLLGADVAAKMRVFAGVRARHSIPLAVECCN